MSATNQVTRTTIQLYRDCLRLAKHIGGNSKKGQAIKDLVRLEFNKGRSETDPEKIEALKANAVRGLSNYLMLANSSKDQRLHDAMNKKSPPKEDGPDQAEYRDLALARKAAGARTVAPSSVSAENVGVENVTKKLELQLAAGDFYGALQMYKTLFMRFLKGDEPSAEQQEKAAVLALEAALQLIQHDQNTAATEMANLMVSVFADFHHPVDDAHKQRIRQISAAFEPKPQFSSDLAVFLKNAVKWSATEGARKRGDPELQLLLARAYRTAGDFTHALKHFLHAENPQELAEALFEWSLKGYPSESDLYLARAVLQLLSLENLRDANKVYEVYVAKCQSAGRPVDLPLFNFSRFLLLTLERDALPLFQMLQERYGPALARDNSLKSYLSVIGQKFYGLQPPRSGLSSLLEMFSGGM